MARYPRIEPPIENPYPGPFERVSDFRYQTRLVLAREPDVLLMREQASVSYIVDQDYTVSFDVDDVEKTLSRTRFPWTQNWLNRSVQGGPGT